MNKKFLFLGAIAPVVVAAPLVASASCTNKFKNPFKKIIDKVKPADKNNTAQPVAQPAPAVENGAK
ncbi:variable surface lipoprotein [Mycoplasma sp. AA7A]|uniref:variable surface lipoprotein n=1 Tax=unclassified Mycoplasma TaxID=2683645 RepID=UPI003AB0F94C